MFFTAITNSVIRESDRGLGTDISKFASVIMVDVLEMSELELLGHWRFKSKSVAVSGDVNTSSLFRLDVSGVLVTDFSMCNLLKVKHSKIRRYSLKNVVISPQYVQEIQVNHLNITKHKKQ